MYLQLAWAMSINNTSNEEFPAKTLEDQQKKSMLYLLYDK